MTEYELNHLPATDFGKRAIKRVSPVYDSSFFYKKFLDALGADYDTIRRYFETLREQRFIQTVQEWGIEYLENKYSVPIIRTDDLETRRARLGIKAWVHSPLNPAVLEKYAFDNYNLRVYLDESEAGYIGVVVNALGNDFIQFIRWLLVERPAHLRLRIILYLFQYVDDAQHFMLPDKVLRQPPLPTSNDDKKNFPRLFSANVLVKHGKARLKPIPFKPPEPLLKLYAACLLIKAKSIKFPALSTFILSAQGNSFVGNLLRKTGALKIMPPRLEGNAMTIRVRAGAVLVKTGRYKLAAPQLTTQTLLLKTTRSEQL